VAFGFVIHELVKNLCHESLIDLLYKRLLAAVLGAGVPLRKFFNGVGIGAFGFLGGTCKGLNDLLVRHGTKYREPHQIMNSLKNSPKVIQRQEDCRKP
jgi:hypothetical protein